MNKLLKSLHQKRGVIKRTLGIKEKGDIAPGELINAANKLKKDKKAIDKKAIYLLI